MAAMVGEDIRAAACSRGQARFVLGDFENGVNFRFC
jgi:hypothetical protein